MTCVSISSHSVERDGYRVSFDAYEHDGCRRGYLVTVRRGADAFSLNTEDEAFARRTYDMWVERYA